MEPAFIFEDGECRLVRYEGEMEADYCLRQAAHVTRAALRARQLMLVRGLQYRERARVWLCQAETASEILPDERRAFFDARVRRLAAALDWSSGDAAR